MGELLFLLFVFGAVYLLHKNQRVSAERFLRERLRADGFLLDELATHLLTDGNTATRYNFRARHLATGAPATGRFVWRGYLGTHEVHFDDGGPSPAPLPAAHGDSLEFDGGAQESVPSEPAVPVRAASEGDGHW